MQLAADTGPTRTHDLMPLPRHVYELLREISDTRLPTPPLDTGIQSLFSKSDNAAHREMPLNGNRDGRIAIIATRITPEVYTDEVSLRNRTDFDGIPSQPRHSARRKCTMDTRGTLNSGWLSVFQLPVNICLNNTVLIPAETNVFSDSKISANIRPAAAIF
jgi:hypothetical protein